MHSNRFKANDRVTVEDFVWLLLEYKAHAPLIKVLVGVLNVLNSTWKGLVTTATL